MSIYNYVSRCSELKRELIESLSTNEIDELRNDCTTLGQEDYDRWLLHNLEDIAAYVAAAPSKRKTLKKWRQHPARPRLVLGAIQHIGRALIFLEAMERNWLFEGISYRDMASNAGKAYFEAFYLTDEKLWPFDPPNPFERKS